MSKTSQWSWFVYRIDGELTPDRGRVLVMAFLIAGAAIPRVLFSSHHHQLVCASASFNNIPRYGGSGRDHGRNASPLRFHSFIFLTRAHPHSQESENDGAANAIGQDSGASQRVNRKRRSVYSVNQLPIGWLIVCASDPRSVGVPAVQITLRAACRMAPDFIIDVLFG